MTAYRTGNCRSENRCSHCSWSFIALPFLLVESAILFATPNLLFVRQRQHTAFDCLFQNRCLVFREIFAGNVLESRKLLIAADLVSEPLSVRVRKSALQLFGFIFGQRRLCLYPSDQPRRDNIGLFLAQPIDVRTAIPPLARQEVV